MCSTEVVLSASNLSLRTDSFQEEGKARKDDRPSSSEEPSDDFTILQKVHHHSNWKRNQNAVYWVKFIPSTRARIAILANDVTSNTRTQSSAGRLHLQSNLSERRSNTVRMTLNATTRTEGDT